MSNTVKEHLAEAGFDSKYGARPLRRAIQTKIEDAMANEILEGRIQQGDTVHVRMVKKKFVCGGRTEGRRMRQKIRKHLIFKGRVQGVGFRFVARHSAEPSDLLAG